MSARKGREEIGRVSVHLVQVPERRVIRESKMAGRFAILAIIFGWKVAIALEARGCFFHRRGFQLFKTIQGVSVCHIDVGW